jgi:23S rRNA (cytidine1920-2'-O)/16S rRNA (cytidine1409-2'-O)-methyltransferase
MTTRLDVLVCNSNPELSRTKTTGLIQRGAVTVDGKVERRPGVKVSPEAVIKVQQDDELLRYVSRAGLKLETALEHFKLDVTGMKVLDAGLSTGGFAQCLLMRGATHVYGVDVGNDQVAESLKSEERLTAMENTDIRKLETLPELVDLVTLDLSFISLCKVAESVVKFLKPKSKVIALIKPQFEVGKAAIGRGGIVSSKIAKQGAVDAVTIAFEQLGFTHKGFVPVPDVATGKKNEEFLSLFIRG